MRLRGFTLQGRLERFSAAFLFLLLTLCLMLIIDIDRPVGGRIDESQAPMETLRTTLRMWPPGAFDAPARGR